MHVPRIVRRVDGHFENKFDMRNQDFQRWIPEILREWTICERISQDCGDKSTARTFAKYVPTSNHDGKTSVMGHVSKFPPFNPICHHLWDRLPYFHRLG